MQSGDPPRLVISVPEYRGYTFRDYLSGRGSAIDGGHVYASYSATWLVLTRSILVVSEYGPRLTATVRSERLFANFPTICLHIGIVRAVTHHVGWQIFQSTVDRHFDIALVVEYEMGAAV
ncbi:hypothetical protein FPQ18DRAFT_302921 [Pyronema domesticum]|nr:hypothetical protein FPQ18DRAFT_302921 [Pyronema domesticum]